MKSDWYHIGTPDAFKISYVTKTLYYLIIIII